MVTTRPAHDNMTAPHSLSLRGKGLSDENLLTFCSNLPVTVTHLDLSSNEISHAGVEQLVNLLKEQTNLKSLCLSDNRIGAEGLQHLVPLLSQGRLEELDLSQNEISGGQLAELGTDALVSMFMVQKFNLKGNELGDNGAEAIAKVLEDERCVVRDLDISNNDITAGIATVLSASGAGGGHLERLAIDDNRPPLALLPGLIGSASNAGLRSLSMRNLDVDDSTAQQIAATVCTQSGDLQELDLRDNRGCSGKGRTALEGLARLKRGLAIHL
jgi:hypothetical protein